MLQLHTVIQPDVVSSQITLWCSEYQNTR